jgi:uncharacterized protein
MKTILAAVLLLAASPAVAGGPSFDCKTAKQPVEKAICADGTLAELDLSMAQAYRQAVQRVSGDAAALEELKKSQRTFVASRNAAFERPDYRLADHMTRRIALLGNIDIDERKTLLNDWASDDGIVSINRAANDRLRVFVSLEEGTRGLFSCHFEGFGKAKGDTVTAAEEAGANEYDGWTVAITRKGRTIVVTETPPAGRATVGPNPFCGARGSLAGVYFGVSDEGHGTDMGSRE